MGSDFLRALNTRAEVEERSYDPRAHGARCDECPLNGERVVPPESPQGKLKLVIVGEAPGRVESYQLRPFVGPSGRLLDTLLRRNDMRRAEAHITNVVLCRPNNERDVPEAAACCAPRLFSEIGELDAKAPLALLGKVASKALLGTSSILRSRGFVWEMPKLDEKKRAAAERASIKPIPRLRKYQIRGNKVRIRKLRLEREKKLEEIERAKKKRAAAELKLLRDALGKRTALPMLHPAFILRSEIWGSVLGIDMERLGRVVRGELKKRQLEDRAPFVIVSSPKELRKVARKLGNTVMIDVETDSADPLTCKLLCVGLSDGERTIVAYPFQRRMVKTLSRLFRNRIIGGHNFFTFDGIVLRRHGIAFTNEQVEDTLIAHHCFASHLPKSLLHVASAFTDSAPWKHKARGEGNTVKGLPVDMTPEDLCKYNAADVRLTSLSWRRMEDDLEPELHVYAVDKAKAQLCAEMREAGIAFDSERARELRIVLRKRMSTLLTEMRRIVRNPGFNPNKPTDIREALYGKLGYRKIVLTPTGLPSTGRAVLEALRGAETVVGQLSDKILRFRAAAKIKSTYLEPTVLEDGRVHADWRIGPRCLPAGELVLTHRGYLPVEQVRVGDRVLSHTGSPRKVIASTKYLPTPIYRVTLSNGLTLRTTGEHPYLLENASWRKARRLRVGDSVRVHSSVEEWRPIQKWPYEVSSWGRVRRTFVMQNSNHLDRLLVQYPKRQGGDRTDYGHLKVTLSRNGSQKRGVDKKDFTVHRLVLNAFGRSRPSRAYETRHLNGIPWDNTIENLAWGTSAENKADALRHKTLLGRYQEGGSTKLTQKQVDEIRAAPKPPYGKRGAWEEEMGARFGVDARHIRKIRSGERWKLEGEGAPRAQFGVAQVVRVEKEPSEGSYGLTVEIDASHVTGGIVTHNSGRLACRIMTLPRYTKDKETNEVDATNRVRECYIAPDGFRFVYFDLRQAEMRFGAHLSQDPKFIEAVESGDVHAGNAKVIFPEAAAKGLLDGESVKSGPGKRLRDITKNAGFAVLYLAVADTVYAYLQAHGFHEVTLSAVYAMLGSLHTTYRTYFSFVDRNVEFVQRHGYLRTFGLGRIQWFGRYPKPQDIANYPIQAGIADHMDERLLRLRDLLLRKIPFARIVAQIHDAAIIECREQDVERVQKLIRDVYEPPVRIRDRPPFNIPIDLKVGQRWSDFA